MIVTVVPAQRSDRYSALKKYCYCESPVPSQVIVTKTISNQQKLTVSFIFIPFLCDHLKAIDTMLENGSYKIHNEAIVRITG